MSWTKIVKNAWGMSGLKQKDKKRLTFSLIFPLLLLLVTMLIATSVKAEKTISSSSNMVVGVERKIDIIKNGYIMINDTFLFSASNESLVNFTLNDFLVGFPVNYSSNMIYYSAHDNEGNLPITKETRDESFQWLKISFPRPINLDNVGAYNFTVTYVFSDLIKRKSNLRDLFHASFPLYPSLIYDAAYCNVTVTLPSIVKVSQDNFPQDIFVNKTENFRVLNNFTSPLTAYANLSSWVEFSSSSFPLFKILELKRDLSIDGLGRISVTDIYEMVIVNVNKITFILPSNATNISVYDAYEKYPRYRVTATERNFTTMVEVTLGEKMENPEKGRIAITYTLPFHKYIFRSNWQSYMLKISLTKPNEWIIGRIIVTITLPEGANFVQEKQGELEIEKIGFFQEKATLRYYNVTKFQNLGILSVSYQYMSLWAAFRPTILAGVLMGFVSLIFFFTRAAGKRAEIVAPAPISPETIRKFVESYEEKMRILFDIDYLEQQLRRRKISRRQYRFQRKTLDGRLLRVQRTISDLQRELEAAGGRYVDMIRRLEAASTDIEAINRSIADIEIRYRRGEISAEAYRQLVREYRRRKEENERVIEETLLRLREEA